ncbi:MAG: metallophosphoesterase family protein [Limnochordia bacterium]
MRFVHVADVHLDTPFYGREEWLRRALRDATRESLRRAVQWALKEQVHVFLIAGDLFDNELLSFGTERFLLEQLSLLDQGGILVCYATGNHDPGQIGYRAQEIQWPDNVILFNTNEPRTVPIEVQGEPIGYVTGAGHSTHREQNSLVADFPRQRLDRPHIGLIHTQIQGYLGDHKNYAPSTREELLAIPVDYWACGHIHKGGQVWPEEKVYYAGNIQGRHPRETGPKGFYYGQLGEGGLEIQFVPSAPLLWEQLSCELPTEVSDFAGLTTYLQDYIIGQLAQGPQDYLVRLDLHGETPLVGELKLEDNIRELTEELQAACDLYWLEIRPGPLLPPLIWEDYRNQPTVLGEILGVLEGLADDDALFAQLIPSQLASKTGDSQTYLRELLKDLPREVVARFVARE